MTCIYLYVYENSAFIFCTHDIGKNKIPPRLSPLGSRLIRDWSAIVPFPGTFILINAHILTYTLPETSIAPEHEPSQKNRILFQSSIFNCYFTFREGNVQLNLLCITCFPIASRHWQSYEASSWSLCLRPAGRLCEDQIWQGHFVCAHMEFGPRNSHSRNVCTRHQFLWVLCEVRFGARWRALSHFSAEFMPGRMLSIKILSEDCIRTLWLSGAGFDHAICNWNRPNCHS